MRRHACCPLIGIARWARPVRSEFRRGKGTGLEERSDAKIIAAAHLAQVLNDKLALLQVLGRKQAKALGARPPLQG